MPHALVLLLVCSVAVFVRGAAAGVVVTAVPQQDHLHFTVVETREFVAGRVGTRCYEFVVPAVARVQAAQVARFHSQYRGPDGTWDTRRGPVSGYIVMSPPRRPRAIEFRLRESWDDHVVPMSINGKHTVSLARR